MRTTPALAAYVADNLGIPESIMRNMLRRIREDGFILEEGHGKGAAIARPRDAATLLLTLMVTDRPVHAGVVAEAVNSLKLEKSEFKTLNGLRVKSDSAVDAVAEIIGAVQSRAKSMKGPVELLMWPAGPSLHISWNGGVWHFSRPEKGKQRFDKIVERGVTANKPEGGLTRRAEVPFWVLENIADWLEGRTE